MSFQVKSTAELEAMTAEQLDAYKSDLANHEKEVRAKEIAEATETVKAELKNQLDALELAKNELTEQINQLKEQSNGVSVMKSEKEQLKDALVEKHEAIKEVLAKGSGVVEIQLKAVANITTANGVNTSPPAITGTQQAPLSNVNLRDVDFTMLTTNLNTSLAAYPYTEAKPKDGDYTFVAEGTAKPQTDFSDLANHEKEVRAKEISEATETLKAELKSELDALKVAKIK